MCLTVLVIWRVVLLEHCERGNSKVYQSKLYRLLQSTSSLNVLLIVQHRERGKSMSSLNVLLNCRASSVEKIVRCRLLDYCTANGSKCDDSESRSCNWRQHLCSEDGPNVVRQPHKRVAPAVIGGCDE